MRSSFPEMHGLPISVRFLPDLTGHRGKLFSKTGVGQTIHAGTFIHKREIVLDSRLKRDRHELSRILVHEIFHFVWARLPNSTRRSYEDLIAGEYRIGARGELGWSAEWRKRKVSQAGHSQRTRRWREYVCESFCDSAAWMFSGVDGHAEFTLPRGLRSARRRWFELSGLTRRISL